MHRIGRCRPGATDETRGRPRRATPGLTRKPRHMPGSAAPRTAPFARRPGLCGVTRGEKTKSGIARGTSVAPLTGSPETAKPGTPPKGSRESGSLGGIPSRRITKRHRHEPGTGRIGCWHSTRRQRGSHRGTHLHAGRRRHKKIATHGMLICQMIQALFHRARSAHDRYPAGGLAIGMPSPLGSGPY